MNYLLIAMVIVSILSSTLVGIFVNNELFVISFAVITLLWLYIFKYYNKPYKYLLVSYVVGTTLLACGLSLTFDPITFISTLGAMVAFWIATLSYFVLFWRNRELRKLVTFVRGDQTDNLVFWRVALIGIMIFYTLAIRANLQYDPLKMNTSVVWKEFVCVFIATLLYVIYDIAACRVIKNAYITHLAVINKHPEMWEGKDYQVQMNELLRRWLSNFQVSYSVVDLPGLIAMIGIFLIVSGFYLVYVKYPIAGFKPEVFRTFVAGAVCFHGWLVSYLFLVNCSEFISGRLMERIRSCRLIMTTDCKICPRIWDMQCAINGEREYNNNLIPCPELDYKDFAEIVKQKNSQ